MVAAVGGQVSFDADSYVCSGHAAWLTPWQMAGEQHAPYRARRRLSVVPVFDRSSIQSGFLWHPRHVHQRDRQQPQENRLQCTELIICHVGKAG